MTIKNGIYKCEKCGNIVAVLHIGKGELVCCGAPMVYMTENTVDAAYEKHVPVVEKTSDGILVKIGGEPHPMVEEHYIEWVEVIVANKVYRQDLKAGDATEVTFVLEPSDDMIVRAYCNLHGLWKA
ncbi:MAG TPA: desulfoferrodoxin [Syntrophomonadaceae bacterium]|nr:desulfoferrodoxin [Syntrophomonadaceae bacterium]